MVYGVRSLEFKDWRRDERSRLVTRLSRNAGQGHYSDLLTGIGNASGVKPLHKNYDTGSN